MNCKFCGHKVEYGPGFIMVESIGQDFDGFIAHEECYQESGQDEGYIERLHKVLEDKDEDVFGSYSF
jgi:hypothetical protein